jgi:hypothetical protein
MTTKTFDAVKLMRELRDKLSQEMGGMTPEERLRYIRDKAASTALGRAIAQDKSTVAQQTDAADRPSAGR